MTMAIFLWIITCFLTPLVVSESGDDDMSDKEVICASTMALIQHELTCYLNDEPPEEITFATLCQQFKNGCTNATLKPKYFTFEKLKATLYGLRVHLRDGIIEKHISLGKIVRIPAPEIKLATYMKDTEEIFIWFEHSHPYVRQPQFEMQIWGEDHAKQLVTKVILDRNISISRDRLSGDGVYYTRLRAKPVGFFEGDWSSWSSNVSVTVETQNRDGLNSQIIPISCSVIFIIFLLLITFGAIKYKIKIRDYVIPNIPHPKETLAQMEKAKEGFPFTFSPEIFRDVFIHHVDYAKEKPLALEPQDELTELPCSRSRSLESEIDVIAGEQFPEEQSHLKIRLLDEKGSSKEMEICSVTLQTECKDEAYVTMSSLFKTQ